MRVKPQLVDKKLIQMGENTLAVYVDQNYGTVDHTLRELKVKMLETALNDLANGGFLLKSRKLGIVYRDNKYFEFNVPYDQPNPPGQITASASLKVMRAFDGFRTKSEGEQTLKDEDKHAAIYYLIYLLSKQA